MILGGGLLTSSWPKASDWLIRDEFTGTVAAGSVNGTAATPGPGTRTVTDTASRLSVGGDVATIGIATGDHDPGLWYGAVTRAAGCAALFKAQKSDNSRWAGGFDTDQAGPAIASNSIFLNNSGSLEVRDGDIIPVGAWAASTGYYFAVILRSAGAFTLAKGGALSNWTMLWSAKNDTSTPLYPATGNRSSGVISLDYLRVIQLPAPFDTDTGLATDVHIGNVAAGTTFIHEADFIIEATVTTRPTAGNADIIFRQSGPTDYWICRVNSAGDISLHEVVAGTPTQRSNTAGVVSSGHRIVIIAEGSTIKLYSNNALRSTYPSATSGATATAGELDSLGTGGVVSDLIAWPRTLSGTATAILDKVSA